MRSSSGSRLATEASVGSVLRELSWYVHALFFTAIPYVGDIYGLLICCRVFMLYYATTQVHQNMLSRRPLMAICAVARGTGPFWMQPRASTRATPVERLVRMVDLGVAWTRTVQEGVAKGPRQATGKMNPLSSNFLRPTSSNTVRTRS